MPSQVDKPDQEWREEFGTVMATYQPGSEAEKRLVRKIDMHIVSLASQISTIIVLIFCSAGAYDLGSLYPVLPRPCQHR